MSVALVRAAEVPDPNALKEAATVARAKAEEAAADKLYKVARNAYGQPDLEGVWTNVSITPLERPSQFGNSIDLTTDQASQLEYAAIEHYIEGNAPTDPNAPATDATRKHCQGRRNDSEIAGRRAGFGKQNRNRENDLAAVLE